MFEMTKELIDIFKQLNSLTKTSDDCYSYLIPKHKWFAAMNKVNVISKELDAAIKERQQELENMDSEKYNKLFKKANKELESTNHA